MNTNELLDPTHRLISSFITRPDQLHIVADTGTRTMLIATCAPEDYAAILGPKAKMWLALNCVVRAAIERSGGMTPEHAFELAYQERKTLFCPERHRDPCWSVAQLEQPLHDAIAPMLFSGPVHADFYGLASSLVKVVVIGEPLLPQVQAEQVLEVLLNAVSRKQGGYRVRAVCAEAGEA